MSDLDLNEVTLRGRLSAPAERRAGHGEGDWLTFRLVVRRPDPAPRTPAVDVLAVRAPATELLAYLIEGLQPGDPIDVRGRLERRFWRTGSGTASVTEVVADQVAKVPDEVVAAAATAP